MREDGKVTITGSPGVARVLLPVFTGIGVLLLVYSAYALISTWLFLDAAQVTQGTVIDVIEKRSSDRDVMYRPVIEYRPDESGSLVTFESRISSSHPSHRTGDTVRVRFLPEDPENARLATLEGTWGGAVISLFVGVMFVGVSRFMSHILAKAET